MQQNTNREVVVNDHFLPLFPFFIFDTFLNFQQWEGLALLFVFNQKSNSTCHLGGSLSGHHQKGKVGRGGVGPPSQEAFESSEHKDFYGGEVGEARWEFTLRGNARKPFWVAKGSCHLYRYSCIRLSHEGSGLKVSPRTAVPAFCADSRDRHGLSPHPVRTPTGVWCAGIHSRGCWGF